MLTTSQPTSDSTPSTPPRPQEVGSSNMFSVRKTSREEITQTYKKGIIMVFSLGTTKEVPTPRPLTRLQTKRLHKKAAIEQVQREMEQSPRHATDSPLQQFEEMPDEQEIFDHGDRSNAEIIKEQQAEIQELKDDLARENHMVSFLKQENKILKVRLMQHDTSQGHPSPNKAKEKGKVMIGSEEPVEGKEPSPSAVQKDHVDPIAARSGKDREYLHERVNEHLENLVRKEKRVTNLQRHMARHYFTRNQICKIRVRSMKRKLKKTLIKLKKKDNLDFLVEDSLVV